MTAKELWDSGILNNLITESNRAYAIEVLEKLKEEFSDIYKKRYSHITREYNNTDQFNDEISEVIFNLKSKLEGEI